MCDNNRQEDRFSELGMGEVVLVMGLTGVGKSSFISKVVGDDIGIGHELESYTQNFGLYSIQLNGRLVHLVDTPGFNDTWRSDNEILAEVTFILSKVYQNGLKIAGVLYLHRISDNRVTGSAYKNFRLLKSICGLAAAPRIFLVPTMWNPDDAEYFQEQQLRELDLVSKWEFWGQLCQHGSQTKRWHGDESSARFILKMLLDVSEGQGYAALTIQTETINQGITLRDTTAGRVLLSGYKTEEKKRSEEIETIQNTRQGQEREVKDAITELRTEIEGLRKAQRDLEASLSHRFLEREKAYAMALSKVHHGQKQVAAQLEREHRKQQRLEEDARQNLALLEEERQQWRIQREELESERRRGRYRPEESQAAHQRINDDEEAFKEQFQELQHQSDSNISATTETIERLRKRDVMKRNLVPMLGALAGTGLAIGAGVTGILPFAGAGAVMAATYASQINLSRKPKVEQSVRDKANGTANAMAAAYHGAGVTSLAMNGSQPSLP